MKSIFFLLSVFIFTTKAFTKDDFKFVSAAGNHSCASNDSDVICWGNNTYGESQFMKGFKNIRKLVTGNNHSCVLDDEGTWCWGFGDTGLLDLSGPNHYDDIFIGPSQTCGLQGTLLKCVGSNSPIKELRNVHQAVIGLGFICVLTNEQVTCFGNPRPPIPANLGRVKSMYAFERGLCLLSFENRVQCFGTNTDFPRDFPAVTNFVINTDGICGYKEDSVICWDEHNKYRTKKFSGTIDQLVAGQRHLCVRIGSEISCWGNNQYGQTTIPPVLSQIDKIYLSTHFSCFFSNNKHTCIGSTYTASMEDFGSGINNLSQVASFSDRRCYIENHDAYCRTGNSDPLKTPNVLQIVMGPDYDCLLLEKGTINCRGTAASSFLKLPTGLEGVSQISGGFRHMCALIEGKVTCWGQNVSNQLEVPEMDSVKKIVANNNHTCALTKNNEVKCWGALFKGSLETPLFDFDIQDIIAGYSFICAHNQEKIVCWGNNDFEQLRAPLISPPIKQVSLGWHHACLLDAQGLKCWGANFAGQINVRTE